MGRLASASLIAACAAGCLAHERGADDAGSASDAFSSPDASIAPTDTSTPPWMPDAFVADDGAAGACRTIRADEWIAPSVVPLGEPIPVLMRANTGASCGCVPSSEVAPPQGPTVSFLLCGCSDVDPCVDPGYDATFVSPTETSAGQRQFYHPYAGGRVIIEVPDPSVCYPTTDSIGTITLVSPDGAHLTSTPAHWWIRVGGTETRCCGAPLVAVSQATTPGTRTTITLSTRECAPDPCDCAIGTPTAYETYADLGPLPAGGYDVVGGTGTLAIDVP